MTGRIIGLVCLWIGLSILADLAPHGWPRELTKLAVAGVIACVFLKYREEHRREAREKRRQRVAREAEVHQAMLALRGQLGLTGHEPTVAITRPGDQP